MDERQTGQKNSAVVSPSQPRPETLQRQVEILREIGTSQRLIDVAVRVAEAAKKS